MKISQTNNPLPDFISGKHRRNVNVTTSEGTRRNERFCWMNIGISKLDHNRAGKWLFDTLIHGERNVYSCSTKELISFLQRDNTPIKKKMYSVTLDFLCGKLYKGSIRNERPESTSGFLCLKKVRSGNEYHKKLKFFELTAR